MTSHIVKRHAEVTSKLEGLVTQVQERQHALVREGEGLLDFQALQILHNDLEDIIVECLKRLRVEEKSVAAAEILAHQCQEIVASSLEKLQRDLRLRVEL